MSPIYYNDMLNYLTSQERYTLSYVMVSASKAARDMTRGYIHLFGCSPWFIAEL